MPQFLTGIKNILIGRLKEGEDILFSLGRIASQHNINAGIILGIGAVRKASVGFYIPSKGNYEKIIFDEEMEILSLLGNISLRDGTPFVHAHITLANKKGESFGGHLLPETICFALEYKIFILNEDNLVREFDKDTGLYLWKELNVI